VVDKLRHDAPDCPACFAEILRLRHHSLFAPRDFDVSPYFAVVKPMLDAGFDFHALTWSSIDGEENTENTGRKRDDSGFSLPDMPRPSSRRQPLPSALTNYR